MEEVLFGELLVLVGVFDDFQEIVELETRFAVGKAPSSAALFLREVVAIVELFVCCVRRGAPTLGGFGAQIGTSSADELVLLEAGGWCGQCGGLLCLVELLDDAGDVLDADLARVALVEHLEDRVVLPSVHIYFLHF